MRISHQHEFVFLSYPRTASRSVREALDRYSEIRSVHVTKTSGRLPFYHHMPAKLAKQAFDRLGWDWYSYHRFCVVRNPYTRVVSLYHHYQSMRTRRAPGFALIPRLRALVRYALERPLSFKEYVLSLDKRLALAMPLYDFIHDDAGTCLVDDVLKLEELAVELPSYLNRLGLLVRPGDIPFVGSSGIEGYKKHYDGETRSYVEDLYRYEIDRFGYTFEDIA